MHREVLLFWTLTKTAQSAELQVKPVGLNLSA